MRLSFLAFALFAFAPRAFAFLPPAHFIYSKLGEQKTRTPVNGVVITVARPQTAGTEEILGTMNISEWHATGGGWPGLTLIFHADTESVFKAVEAFGLEIFSEQQLMRLERSKLSQMKDPPDPFYKPDPTMSLKRARQTYAWVHGDASSGRSVWIEKDSFLPLKIAAPCPPQVANLAWAKTGENKCELEFRNLFALRHGNLQSARMVLWKDGAPLLFLTFDRLATLKAKLPPDDGKISPDVKEIVETVLH